MLGMVLARTPRVPEALPGWLNAWLIRVALPVSILVHVPKLAWEPSLLVTASTGWVVFVGAGVFLVGLRRRLGLSREALGALWLTCGLGNTSFVGIPMITVWYGPEAVATGLIADQFGSFLVLSSLGIGVASWLSGGSLRAGEMARRLVMFPPFPALLVALVVETPLDGWMVGGWGDVVRLVAWSLGPVALVSVGLRIRWRSVRERGGLVGVGLAYKLLVAPALMMGVVWLSGVRGLAADVAVFQAAMGPMVTGGILASERRLDPELASAVVGAGIPLSLATLPLWWWVQGLVGGGAG